MRNLVFILFKWGISYEKSDLLFYRAPADTAGKAGRDCRAAGARDRQPVPKGRPVLRCWGRLGLRLPCRPDRAPSAEELSRHEADPCPALPDTDKGLADKVVYTEQAYTRGCMHKRNRHLVDNSSVCVCYLNRESGGTAYTVDYAGKQGLEIINLAR